jgi:hypothetical protein
VKRSGRGEEERTGQDRTRKAAVAWWVEFARGLRPRSLVFS